MVPNVTFDYTLLRTKIEEYGGVERVARIVDMQYLTLIQRITNQRSFKQKEILALAELLKIPTTKFAVYFFTVKGDEPND